MSLFYCEVISRVTGESLAVYDKIEAADWYYARHRAADRYAAEHPSKKSNWYVDSLQVTEDGQLVD